MPYKDPKVNYQELSCKRNAPRWIKQIKEYKNWEVTIKNTETGEVYTNVEQRDTHEFSHVRLRSQPRHRSNLHEQNTSL